MQSAFLSYQVDNVFTWVTCSRVKAVFCLVGQETRLDHSPWGLGLDTLAGLDRHRRMLEDFFKTMLKAQETQGCGWLARRRDWDVVWYSVIGCEKPCGCGCVGEVVGPRFGHVWSYQITLPDEGLIKPSGTCAFFWLEPALVSLTVPIKAPAAFSIMISRLELQKWR